jgi:hypothetical protein
MHDRRSHFDYSADACHRALPAAMGGRLAVVVSLLCRGSVFAF